MCGHYTWRVHAETIDKICGGFIIPQLVFMSVFSDGFVMTKRYQCMEVIFKAMTHTPTRRSSRGLSVYVSYLRTG